MLMAIFARQPTQHNTRDLSHKTVVFRKYLDALIEGKTNMKSFTAASVSAAVALACSSAAGTASAFVVAHQHHNRQQATELQVQAITSDGFDSPAAASTSRRDLLATAGAVAGWIISPRIASAAGAYVPESGYEKVDMSFPSYKVEDSVDPLGVGGVSAGGGDDGSQPLSDPVKEAERLAKAEAKKKAAAEKEAAKARAYYEKMKEKERKDAEKARIKAEVEAGRAAAREAKLKSKIPTE